MNIIDNLKSDLYKVLSTFSDQIKIEDIVIEKNALFDYLWIDDLGKIIRRFLTHWPAHKIINVTPDTSVTLGAIAKQVQKISGAAIQVKCGDVLNNAYTGDNSVLREELPDLSFTPLEEGLSKLYLSLAKNL